MNEAMCNNVKQTRESSKAQIGCNDFDGHHVIKLVGEACGKVEYPLTVSMHHFKPMMLLIHEGFAEQIKIVKKTKNIFDPT